MHNQNQEHPAGTCLRRRQESQRFPGREEWHQNLTEDRDMWFKSNGFLISWFMRFFILSNPSLYDYLDRYVCSVYLE